jgi:gamma-glutamylcyclotransferase (GGCT)/AIG2-like uncharacterized protein YtfP
LNECERLWVYGSLLSGFFNHVKVLEGRVISLYPARIKGRLFHQLHKGYPALLNGSDSVNGELLQIRDLPTILPLVAELEGYAVGGVDNEYDRRLSQVFYQQDGAWLAVSAYVYWYARRDLEIGRAHV